MQTEVDVLIIGAGPAGAMAASLLQREGFRLLVVEKQQFPRFAIGESLLPQSMSLLQDAGLLDAIEQQHFMQKNGAIFFRGDERCNFDFSAQFTAGWNYTFQVPRADFDKTLADAVAARGVEFLYGQSVTAISFDESHATVTLEGPSNDADANFPLPSTGGGTEGEGCSVSASEKSSQSLNSSTPHPGPLPVEGRGREFRGASRTVVAKFVLDCSGFGRVLPRLLNLEKPSDAPAREALFTHVEGDVRPEGREEGKIWICIHPQDAWIWVIPFSDGRTSVGVVAKPEFFERFPSDPEARLRAILLSDPNAAPRLSAMKFLFTPQRMGGYACGVKQLYGPRFALVGNATEFLDPIFSSGVALAFASATRAAQVLTRQLRGETVDWQTAYADYVMQGIDTFRAYVNSWYDGILPNIFFASQANPGIMRQVCSVLAGYVWDMSNPYVSQPERALPLLAQIIQARASAR